LLFKEGNILEYIVETKVNIDILCLYWLI